MLAAMESRPDAGMCASQVRHRIAARAESIPPVCWICGDGSSKQRSFLEIACDKVPRAGGVCLLPKSGQSAALYRRAVLD